MTLSEYEVYSVINITIYILLLCTGEKGRTGIKDTEWKPNVHVK